MLDYRMETFLTLCKERNYSKAAKKLCITQPAITQHIQHLERYYDTKLFEYSNKQVNLTEQGRILERYALGMNFSTQQVHEVISQSKGGPIKLHIGATPIIEELLMPKVLERLIINVPELRLIYDTRNTKELLEGLKKGTYSCVYLEGPFKKDEYEYRLLGTDEIIPVSGTPMNISSPSDLLSSTLICRETGSGLRKATDDLLYHNGITVDDFKNHVEVNNMMVMKHLIKTNTGIGFVYKSYVQKELEEGTLHRIPLNLTTTQEFNFVVLKECLFLDLYINLYNFSKRIADNLKEKGSL